MGLSSKQAFPALISDPRTSWRQDLRFDTETGINTYRRPYIHRHTHIYTLYYILIPKP